MKFKLRIILVVLVFAFPHQSLLAQAAEWGWPTKVERVPETLKFSPAGIVDCTREVYWGVVGDVNGDGWNDIAVSGWLFNRKSKARTKLEMNCIFDGTSGDCLYLVANTSVREEDLDHLRGSQYVFDAGDVDADRCDDFILYYRCDWTAEPNEWGVQLISGKNLDTLGNAACFADLPTSTLYLKGLYDGMPTFYFVKEDGSVIALQYGERSPKGRNEKDAEDGEEDVVVAGGLYGGGRQAKDLLVTNISLARDAEFLVATGKLGSLGRTSTSSMVRVEPKVGLTIEVATSRSSYPDSVTKVEPTEPTPGSPTPEKPTAEQPKEDK